MIPLRSKARVKKNNGCNETSSDVIIKKHHLLQNDKTKKRSLDDVPVVIKKLKSESNNNKDNSSKSNNSIGIENLVRATDSDLKQLGLASGDIQKLRASKDNNSSNNQQKAPNDEEETAKQLLLLGDLFSKLPREEESKERKNGNIENSSSNDTSIFSIIAKATLIQDLLELEVNTILIGRSKREP